MKSSPTVTPALLLKTWRDVGHYQTSYALPGSVVVDARAWEVLGAMILRLAQAAPAQQQGGKTP